MTSSENKDLVRSEVYRALIAPVAEDMLRPLWSVMIPSYNCAHYLRETLAAVLAQDPGPELMQIEVVDDCSTQDDPAAIVEEVGRGRVGFYCQQHNVGHIRNFNTCLQRSRGRLIHLLHGDDYVREGFYRTMQQPFAVHPELGAAFCRFITMNEEGHWQSIYRLEQSQSGILDNWLETIATGQRLQTPAMVVRREVYERLGGFDQRIRAYGEDWEMWVRIAANYPVWYQVEPLAIYRIRPASLSDTSFRTGANIQDLRHVIEIIRSYVPPERARAIAEQAREACARSSFKRIRRLIVAGTLRIPLGQVREALICSHSVRVFLDLCLTTGLWIVKALHSSISAFRVAGG